MNQELKDLLDDINQAEVEQLLDWLKQDPANPRQFKRAFAKQGLFAVDTLLDVERANRHMAQGKGPVAKEFWMADIYPGHPLHIERVCRTLVKRPARTKYTMRERTSPLKLTPHAWARYREHTGAYFQPTDAMFDIPHIPDLLLNAQQQIRTDVMLPYDNGAFLGYTSHIFPAPTSTFEMHYKKNHQPKQTFPADGDAPVKFYALTYILCSQMFDWQLEVYDLYNEGKYEAALEINKANENPNAVKDCRIVEFD